MLRTPRLLRNAIGKPLSFRERYLPAMNDMSAKPNAQSPVPWWSTRLCALLRRVGEGAAGWLGKGSISGVGSPGRGQLSTGEVDVIDRHPGDGRHRPGWHNDDYLAGPKIRGCAWASKSRYNIGTFEEEKEWLSGP
jgi:hypothetical protein